MSAKDTPKIALLGPIAPFRGGIAQYNSRLYESLEKRCDIRAYSFKRQYPKLLYPGRSDKDPGSMAWPDGKNVCYWLNVYSPLSLRRVVRDIVRNDFDVVILTWWTLLWQPGFVYISRLLKKKGIKTIFLCHNVADHDSHGIKSRLSMYLLRQADAYIVHATEEESLIRKSGISKPVLNTKSLPVYDHYPRAKVRLPKRGRVELLFFGFIRPYKGLDVLVEALSLLKDKEVYVSVVGEAWSGEEELIAKATDGSIPNLELNLTYVDSEKAAEYFERADVVVLPYKSATGSAVVSVAYHYDKPVLATNVGGLRDSVIEGRTGWIVAPSSPEALAAVIAKLDRDKAESMRAGIRSFRKEHSWQNMAKLVEGFATDLSAH